MLLSDAWLTTAWAIQALIFMWMSVKMKSNLVRLAAYLLYLLTFARLATHDLSVNFHFARSATPYWGGMLDRFMTMGVTILSLVCSFRLLKSTKAEEDGEAGAYLKTMSANDIGTPMPDTTTGKVLFWLAFAFLFGYLQFELCAFCGAYYPPMKTTIVSFIWLVAMLYLIVKRNDLGPKIILKLLGWLIAAYLLKLLFFDLAFWDFTINSFIYSGDYSYESGFMRLLDFIPSVLFFAYAAFVFREHSKGRADSAITPDRIFGIMAVILLFLYATFELNTFLACKAPGFRAGGISILWSLFAIFFLLTGILKNMKLCRYSGLALFAVVVVKVFFSDLSRLDQLYRIIAFVALGLIILAAAFLYVRFKTVFEKREDAK
jgi:uncharacterized membrane protein